MGKSNDNPLKGSIPIATYNSAVSLPKFTERIHNQGYSEEILICIKNIGEGIWTESIAFTLYTLDTFFGITKSIIERELDEKRIFKTIDSCNSFYWKKDTIVIRKSDVRLSTNDDTKLNSRLQQVGIHAFIPDTIVCHQKRALGEFTGRIYFFGYDWCVHRLLGFRVIPPILSIDIVPMIFVAPSAFFALLLICVILIGSYTQFLLIGKRKPKWLISTSIRLMRAFASYIFGFWKDTVEILSKREAKDNNLN